MFVVVDGAAYAHKRDINSYWCYVMVIVSMMLAVKMMFSLTILLMGWCTGTCAVAFCLVTRTLYSKGHSSCVLYGDLHTKPTIHDIG